MNIIITGTSSGIGHGLAQEYLERGAEVWGISRRPAHGLSQHDHYRHLPLDLTEYEEVERRVPEFLAGRDPWDLVILNAGVLGPIQGMNELTLDEIKRVMDINVWANKMLLDILFREAREIRQVVGMSTKASLRSSPGWGPYSVSKAGLNMLMNVYAKEYPDTHFSAFAPGLVDSEIQEAIYQMEETDKYPTLKRLQEARYTDEMPEPRGAAPMLIRGIKEALEHESGSYVDVREM